MTYSKILYDVREHQATVTINRPEVYNAFDYQTLREMEKAFQDAADDDRVSVLILTGAGDKYTGKQVPVCVFPCILVALGSTHESQARTTR